MRDRDRWSVPGGTVPEEGPGVPARYTPNVNLTSFPGYELVRRGIDDLAVGRETAEAFLVAIGAERLRRAGLTIPDAAVSEPEHRLYELLAREDSDSAHSRYNALIRQLVSFERAVECAA